MLASSVLLYKMISFYFFSTSESQTPSLGSTEAGWPRLRVDLLIDSSTDQMFIVAVTDSTRTQVSEEPSVLFVRLKLNLERINNE
jgi:hypothetical protein